MAIYIQKVNRLMIFLEVWSQVRHFQVRHILDPAFVEGILADCPVVNFLLVCTPVPICRKLLHYRSTLLRKAPPT